MIMRATEPAPLGSPGGSPGGSAAGGDATVEHMIGGQPFVGEAPLRTAPRCRSCGEPVPARLANPTAACDCGAPVVPVRPADAPAIVDMRPPARLVLPAALPPSAIMALDAVARARAGAAAAHHLSEHPRYVAEAAEHAVDAARVCLRSRAVEAGPAYRQEVLRLATLALVLLEQTLLAAPR